MSEVPVDGWGNPLNKISKATLKRGSGLGTLIYTSGSGTFTTITHGLPWTPSAGEIVLTRTSKVGSGGTVDLYVNNIGATTWEVHTGQDENPGTLTFGWSAVRTS